MESTVKAAATVQNNILLVQYSPTGFGIGDLYAILMSNPSKPLPFQIQRQRPGLQGSTNSVATMSLTTLQFKAPPPPAGGPDGGGRSPADTSPQLLAQSLIDPNANKSVAVTPAPPFSDLVLAVNLAVSETNVWHLQAPDRSVPPGSPASFPPATGGGPGAGAGTGPTTASKLPAPLWTESPLPQSFFPNAVTVSVGGQRAWSSKSASILTMTLEKNGDAQFSRLVCRRPDSESAGSLSQQLLVVEDSQMPSSETGIYKSETASSALVGITSDKIFGSNYDATDKQFHEIGLREFPEAVVACASIKDYIIAIVPDSESATSRPAIQLFNLKKLSWSKAQLVEAPPGTFSDLPPPPDPENPSGDPGKAGPGGSPGGGAGGGGGGGGEGSNNPSNGGGESSANDTTSRTILIGGIVGGIVVLGSLLFAVFFFSRRRRRRASKQQTDQNERSGFSPKPMAYNDTFYEEPRFYESDRDTKGSSGGRNPATYDHHEMSWSAQPYNPNGMSRPGTNNRQQDVPWPTESYNEQHEAPSPGADHHHHHYYHHQEMAWSPSTSSQQLIRPSANSPQEISREMLAMVQRVNSPQETTREMIPMVRRVHGPQTIPNHRLRMKSPTPSSLPSSRMSP
ncbi:hypothetical protein DFQ27_003601 [Actinomortierella ambigua]|uniref:Uncharacterized protein n=1 Tax=Actinomortierella ambigua TaxID=1343610 RepID=A0A9P6Q717_9FUNG|nr:hypothetical protein DFQ27_003601 [Actinomortierella ambigua]